MVGQTADRVVLELEARTARYMANVNAAQRDFSRRMELMSSSALKMEKSVSGSANLMTQNLGRAIALIGVGAAVKNAQELADAWTSSANKLAAAGVAMEDVGKTQQQLADLARETRSEYASTADLYAKFTRSTKDLGASQEQVARATETVNKAFKAGGASTQEQISSILQLSQALGSGVLQGDELRSIRENAPLLARAIAQEFDTTVGGLKKLGAEGELTADRVFKAILAGSQQIDAQFAVTRSTIGEAFTALRTEAGRFINEFDRATGATQGISGFVNKVADDFDLLAQAVTVSSAVVATAMGVRLTRSLAQTATENSAFVRSIMSGTLSLNAQAEAARKSARDTLLIAQANREAARETIVSARQRIVALEQEAAAYRQNIALAEAQRAVAARQVETGRDARGNFVSQSGARDNRDTSTKAVIASRLQLNRVTREMVVAESALTAATNGYTAAASRASAAQVAMTAALTTTSFVTRAAAVSIRGLSIAMSFFGGPVGVAIMAVAGALTYFATEAAKAKVAGENAQAILDDVASSADTTRGSVSDLSKGMGDNKKATDNAAGANRGIASAFDSVATAAANAAEQVKYLTAAQRQQQLEKTRDAIQDLDKQIGGFNPIATNDQERAANARRALAKKAGIGGTGAAFGSSEVFIQQQRAAVKAGKATKEVADAVLEYDNALAVLADNQRRRAQLEAQAEVINRNIAAPTLKRPTLDTSNITTVPPGGGAGSSGGKGGKGASGPSPAELAAQREMLDLQSRINVARASGAEELAEFLEDQQTLIEQTDRYLKAGLGQGDAEARAQANLDELKAARELAKVREEAEDREKENAKWLEEQAERELDLKRQALFLEQNSLQVQLEIARAAGNSERVKELERQLDLLARIREYEDQGGLAPEVARTKAEEDQTAVETAEAFGRVSSYVKEGIRAALDGDLSAFLENFWFDALSRANDRVIDTLFDALQDVMADIDWSSIFKGDSGINNLLEKMGSAIFGGGRAGGGLMQSGRVYKVGENGPEWVSVGNTAAAFPNSQFKANDNQGGGSTVVQVINNTGVAASASVERTPQATKITLQPMLEKGVEGAGASGALRKGLMNSPRPVRRA